MLLVAGDLSATVHMLDVRVLLLVLAVREKLEDPVLRDAARSGGDDRDACVAPASPHDCMAHVPEHLLVVGLARRPREPSVGAKCKVEHLQDAVPVVLVGIVQVRSREPLTVQARQDHRHVLLGNPGQLHQGRVVKGHRLGFAGRPVLQDRRPHRNGVQPSDLAGVAVHLFYYLASEPGLLADVHCLHGIVGGREGAATALGCHGSSSLQRERGGGVLLWQCCRELAHGGRAW